jgi:hypothetical protein
MVRATAACAVVALAFAAASCGGDDSSSSSRNNSKGNSSVSKSEFIKNATAVCKDFADQAQAKSSSLPNTATQQQQAQFVIDELVPLFRQEVQHLRDLDAPAADADTLNQIWDKLDSGADTLEQKLKDDPAGAFSGSFDPFKEANQQATAYGLKDCAEA